MKKFIISLLASSLLLLGSMGFVANAAPVTPINGGGTQTSTIPADGYLLIGQGGRYIFIASSSLGGGGSGTTTINGFSGSLFQILAGSGITSTILNGSTTFTLNLSSGCSGNNFVSNISPTGTITCATPSGGASSTNVFGINGVNVNQIGTNATASLDTTYAASWSALESFLNGINASGTLNVTGTIRIPSTGRFVVTGIGGFQTGNLSSLNFNLFSNAGLELTTGGSATSNIAEFIDANQNIFTKSNLNASGTITQAGVPVLTTTTSIIAGGTATGNTFTIATSTGTGIWNAGCGGSTCTFTIPSNVSFFANDANYLTSALQTLFGLTTSTISIATGTQVGTFNVITQNGNTIKFLFPPMGDQYFAPSTTIPTNTNQLTNGSGFITSSSISFWANGQLFVTTGTIKFSAGANITLATSSDGTYTISSSASGGSGTVTTSSAFTSGNIPIINGASSIGNSSLSQAAGTTFINGVSPIIDGGGDWLNNVIQTSPSNVVQAASLVWGGTAGNVAVFTANTTITSSTFCGANYGVAENTTSSITLTFPGLAAILQTSCAGSFPQQSFTLFANNSTNTVSFLAGASETILFAPGTPSVMQPNTVYVQNGGYATSTNGQPAFQFQYTMFQTSTPLNVGQNSVSIGTSTVNGILNVVNSSGIPLARLSSSTVATSSPTLNVWGSSSTAATQYSVFQVLGDGHINTTGTVPTLSSCGTNPTTTGQTDEGGEITVGSVSATTCTDTFQIPYESSAMSCTVSSQTPSIAFGYTYTTTALVITDASGFAGDKFDWQCHLTGT